MQCYICIFHVIDRSLFKCTYVLVVYFADLYKNSAQFLLLRGRCLNVAPEFSQAAEECLSRAVKLEPGLVEAWNTLGEQYWKKGDLIAAKTCFTGALQQVRVRWRGGRHEGKWF